MGEGKNEDWPSTSMHSSWMNDTHAKLTKTRQCLFLYFWVLTGKNLRKDNFELNFSARVFMLACKQSFEKNSVSFLIDDQTFCKDQLNVLNDNT